MTEIRIGQYVLATKFHDGDPCDHFCVGFVSEINGDRYIIVNNEGEKFRANGFRRAEPITEEEGTKLLKLFPEIGDVRGPSLWWHLDKIRNNGT